MAIHSTLKRTLALILFALCTIEGTWAEQPYPSKPIHLVVPQGAGSSTDILARKLAVEILEKTGQPVIVENRAGAEGIIGTLAVKTAEHDGYTLLLTTS